MTEGVNTIVQKKLRNLWIGIGLLFVMIVVLFVILLSSHLFLYDCNPLLCSSDYGCEVIKLRSVLGLGGCGKGFGLASGKAAFQAVDSAYVSTHVNSIMAHIPKTPISSHVTLLPNNSCPCELLFNVGADSRRNQ